MLRGDRATRGGLAVAAMITLVMTGACGEPAGSPCEIVGSGFHARDACRHKCLSRWQLSCPDGERITPNTCTGRFGCEPGGCPDGQLCYHDDDPFDDRSFCIPADVCGPLDAEAGRRFELERVAAQAAVRAERAAKEARRARWRAENPDAGKISAAADAAAATGAPAARRLPDSEPDSEPLEPAGPEPAGPADDDPAESPAPDTPAAAQSPGLPALPCVPTAERMAFRIPTPDGEAAFDATVAASLARGESFTAELPHGWLFALLPNEHGWSLRVFDRIEHEGRVDLSAVTPPHHLPTNPRDIEGWHFRNAAGDGPNRGDVNAPQELRLFSFSTGLIGTGGFRPPTHASPPQPHDGRGWLRMLDYTLPPPAPKRQADLLSMRFQACLTWPHPTPERRASWEARREASQQALDARNPRYRPEEIQEIGSCGLDLEAYPLDARILPRRLALDIDGDEVADAIYPIRRVADGAPMLALCRGGTWLDLIGPGHPLLADPDLAHLVRAQEAWRVVPADHGPLGYIDEAPWPDAPAGDVVVLERIEKQAGILFWKRGALDARSLHRFAEP